MEPVLYIAAGIKFLSLAIESGLISEGLKFLL